MKEIGKTFFEVLKDAGVFKDNEASDRHFMKFIRTMGAEEK